MWTTSGKQHFSDVMANPEYPFLSFLCKLQSNLCCWSQLHKTDQSDYRKLILNMEFNLNSLSCIFVLFFFLDNTWHSYNLAQL